VSVHSTTDIDIFLICCVAFI